MKFRMVESHREVNSNAFDTAFLVVDRWDDWGSYRTQFSLLYVDGQGEKVVVGNVKISHSGLKPGRQSSEGVRAPSIFPSFSALPDGYFSLGQEEDYYGSLHSISSDIASDILLSLRDVAYDTSLFEKYRHEDSMEKSLLRYISPSTVTGNFHRRAIGDAALTPFDFSYSIIPFSDDDSALDLKFRVSPYHQPPTNVHAMIGRNGVGKTTILQDIARAVVEFEHTKGSVTFNTGELEEGFAGLVFVSFSVFDDYDLPSPKRSRLRAAQVSLRGDNAVADEGGEPTRAATMAFLRSMDRCREGPRRQRWVEAIKALGSDPLFAEADFESLLELDLPRGRQTAKELFERLSSGHAVVLLTITRLVELVDERTLVLMDEPEGHLHPPLLSALVRALSDLLIKRNGVAIIATHSPVVLQEIPRSCVWILRRSGAACAAERPEVETFGENVGTLTREVFGLEVTSSGFHKLLADVALEVDGDYDALVERFNDQLGSEARSIARSLCSQIIRAII